MNLRSRALVSLFALACVATTTVGLTSAHADTPAPNGGAVTDACRAQQDSVPYAGVPACRTIQNGEWQASAACRTPLYAAPDPSATEQCAAIDGRPISDAAIAQYQSSWVHQALTLQRGLDQDQPLTEELLGHTHNSFNASQYRVPTDGSLPRYYPTLTNQDSNQVYDITGQLNMDIRAIEIDLHWLPSPYGTAATGGNWVTLCHGDSQQAPVPGSPTVHVGCSADRAMEAGLQEVKAWLDAHPDEVVLLYLENQLSGSVQAHQVAGDLLHQYLGSYIEPTPAGQPCAPMPLDQSRAQIHDAGYRLLVVGNCDVGAGTSWGAFVHERGPQWDEHGDPSSYSAGSPKCLEDEAARANDTSFRRYFEDSTWVAAMVGSNPATSSLGGTSTITTDATAAMVRCGVNIIGFDQLTPTDPRLAALVWSWAPDQPVAAGGCAEERGDTRFEVAACSTPMRYACVGSDKGWHVTATSGPWAQGFSACGAEFPGTRFAVPANGYRNARLADAKQIVGATDVWLNYSYSATLGSWIANAASPGLAATARPRPGPPHAVQHVGGTPSAGTPALRLVHHRSSLRQWGWLLVLGLTTGAFGAGLRVRRTVTARAG